MSAHVQLLALRFDPGAAFEGRLVGALERVESGGALRVRDVLFVGRDPDNGELLAVAARGKGQGAIVTALLGFRLDPAERGRATERALRAYDGDGDANPLRRLAETLPQGGAFAAVLVEHVWARAFDDAVGATGATVLLDTRVAEQDLAALSEELVAAAARAGPA